MILHFRLILRNLAIPRPVTWSLASVRPDLRCPPPSYAKTEKASRPRFSRSIALMSGTFPGSSSSDLYYPTMMGRWSSRLSAHQTNSSSTTTTNSTSSSAAAGNDRDPLDPTLPFTHSPQSSFREVSTVGDAQVCQIFSFLRYLQGTTLLIS